MIDDKNQAILLHKINTFENLMNSIFVNINKTHLTDLVAQILIDYEELENNLKSYNQIMSDIDVACVNGILDASNLQDKENISSVLIDIKSKINTLVVQANESEQDFKEKKIPLFELFSNIDRMENVLESIKELKKEL